jgi:hypothetical protein
MAWRSYFLEFCEAKLRKVKLAGKEAGCKDFQVFALQKPKAKKWHGGRIFWSFAKQNSERSNCRHGGRLYSCLGFCGAKTYS